MMAENGDGRGSGRVVFRGEHAAAQRAHAQRGKIAAGDVFGVQGPGRGFDAHATHTQTPAAGLKGGHFFKLRFSDLAA